MGPGFGPGQRYPHRFIPRGRCGVGIWESLAPAGLIRGGQSLGRKRPLIYQAVELGGVLTGDLVHDLEPKPRELLRDVFRGFRPDAVGVRSGHRWCEPPERTPPPGGGAIGCATVLASVAGTNCRSTEGGPIWWLKRPGRDSMRACNPLPANANDRGAERRTAVGAGPTGVNVGAAEPRMAVGREAVAPCMFTRGIIAAELADPRNTWIGPREAKAPEGRLSREGSRCQMLVAVPGI